jgi:hypothetical protein
MYAVRAGRRVSLAGEKRQPEKINREMVEERVNRSFFGCLAAIRKRSSAGDTLSRFCARLLKTGPASAIFWISRLNPYPIGSLCTLPNRRHRRLRNTRYREPATTLPGPDFPGWNLPASPDAPKRRLMENQRVEIKL